MPKLIKVVDGIEVFAENRLPFGDALPLLSDSTAALLKMKRQRIVRISRLIAKPICVLETQGLLHGRVFDFAPGPIFLFFESGLCLGFCPSYLNSSLLVWEEAVPVQITAASTKCSFFDHGLLIDCTDPDHGSILAAGFIGKSVENLTILKTHIPPGRTERAALSERGLALGMDDGGALLLAVRLQAGYPFGLTVPDRIDADIIKSIEYIGVR